MSGTPTDKSPRPANEAERAGLSKRRVSALRDRLASPVIDLATIERTERGLTAWMAERVARDAAGWASGDR